MLYINDAGVILLEKEFATMPNENNKNQWHFVEDFVEIITDHSCCVLFGPYISLYSYPNILKLLMILFQTAWAVTEIMRRRWIITTRLQKYVIIILRLHKMQILINIYFVRILEGQKGEDSVKISLAWKNGKEEEVMQRWGVWTDGSYSFCPLVCLDFFFFKSTVTFLMSLITFSRWLHVIWEHLRQKIRIPRMHRAPEEPWLVFTLEDIEKIDRCGRKME